MRVNPLGLRLPHPTRTGNSPRPISGVFRPCPQAHPLGRRCGGCGRPRLIAGSSGAQVRGCAGIGVISHSGLTAPLGNPSNICEISPGSRPRRPQRRASSPGWSSAIPIGTTSAGFGIPQDQLSRERPASGASSKSFDGWLTGCSDAQTLREPSPGDRCPWCYGSRRRSGSQRPRGRWLRREGLCPFGQPPLPRRKEG
jgi:hypothetical protein